MRLPGNLIFAPVAICSFVRLILVKTCGIVNMGKCQDHPRQTGAIGFLWLLRKGHWDRA
jgi:hypothetical protein